MEFPDLSKKKYTSGFTASMVYTQASPTVSETNVLKNLTHASERKRTSIPLDQTNQK